MIMHRLSPLLTAIVIAQQTFAWLYQPQSFSKTSHIPRKPVLFAKLSGDDKEDVSLINILTVFEQMKSRTNIRNSRISSDLEKSTNRILDQFLKGFEERYSLAKESIASIAVSLNDGDDDTLSEESKLVKSLVLEQLARIENTADDILFYNEPLSKFQETAVPLILSSNIFDFCKASSIRQKVLLSKVFTKTNIESYLRSDGDDVEIKLRPEDAESSRLNALGNVKGIVKKVEQRQLERSKQSREWFEREELKKIKLGINAERRRWRKGMNNGESVVDVATRRLALTNRYLARVVDNILVDQAVKYIQNETISFPIDFKKIDSNMRSYIETTKKAFGRALVDPTVIGIIGIDSTAFDKRIASHMISTTMKKRQSSISRLSSCVGSVSNIPNFPLLIHSCLLLSMATYNLDLEVPEDFKALVNKVTEEGAFFGGKTWNTVSDELDKSRAASMAAFSVGYDCFKTTSVGVKIMSVRSSTACALVVYNNETNTAFLSFRGTKDPIDVITDLNVLSAEFVTLDPSAEEGLYLGKMEVHLGFLKAFESINMELTLIFQTSILETFSENTKLIVCGHSMGGALAQIAAGYYSHMSPVLVTFGSPSIGNAEFCNYIERRVSPAGGLRVWNDFDAIPYLAQIVGYKHAGVPIRFSQKDHARDLYMQQSINELPAALNIVTPHILYQLGSLVHVFPVLGLDEFSEAS